MHLAKNVLFDDMLGVLLGSATVLFAVSYQVMLDGESQPLAVSVVMPETTMVEGMAIGLVGAPGLLFTVTKPVLALLLSQLPSLQLA